MNIYLDIETIPGPNAETISPRRTKRSEVGDYGRPENPESDNDYGTRLATSGTTCQIICIGYAIGDEAPVSLIGEEVKILETFWPILRGHSLYVGHNLLDFDLKIIIQRSTINKIPPTTLIPFTRFRSAPVFDTMHEWMKWHGRVSLNELALALGIPSPKEDMNGAEVWPAWQRGEIDRIAEYCKKDVATTREVYKRLVGK